MKNLLFILILLFPIISNSQVIIFEVADIDKIEEGQTWVIDPKLGEDPEAYAELSFKVDQEIEGRLNQIDDVPSSTDFTQLKADLKKPLAPGTISGKYTKQVLMDYARWKNYPFEEWEKLNKTPLIKFLIENEK